LHILCKIKTKNLDNYPFGNLINVPQKNRVVKTCVYLPRPQVQKF
jgi:hypothetical protein